MTCRDCRFFDVPANRLGRRVPVKNHVYPCIVEIQMPAMPPCITKSYAWRWPIERQFVSADDGANCPAHQPLLKRR